MIVHPNTPPSGLPEGFSGPVVHSVRGRGGRGRAQGGKKGVDPVSPPSPVAERELYCPPLVLETSSEVGRPDSLKGEVGNAIINTLIY